MSSLTPPPIQPARNHRFPRYSYAILAALMVLICLSTAVAQEQLPLPQRLQLLEQAQAETQAQQLQHQVNLDTLWVLWAGGLVFFMNAGFAMLETGFCRTKNSITVLAKNLMVFGLTIIAFWTLGFGFMFGDGTPLIGTSGFFLFDPAENSPSIGDNYQGVFTALNWARLPLAAKFFFQLTFAGTAATIVSGAVAERIKFTAFLCFSPLLVGFSYAITGHWVWGGGWLQQLGFWDFAGSTVVHSVGGWAGLVGTLLLGPRLGKYNKVTITEFRALPFKARSIIGNWRTYRHPQQVNVIPPENLGFATLGCLILWFGWLGFNAGSTLEANALANAHIITNTMMAGATGGLGATIGGWLYFSKPSLAFIINGILAGCVSITAPCAYVDVGFAAIIGFCGGLLVIFSTVMLDKMLIDDPVSAIPVHLCCGIWGTLAVGLFSYGPEIYPKYGLMTGPAKGLLLGGGLQPFVIQLIGIIAIGLFTVIFSLLAWLAIYGMLGNSLRVSEQLELDGLDDAFDDL